MSECGLSSKRMASRHGRSDALTKAATRAALCDPCREMSRRGEPIYRAGRLPGAVEDGGRESDSSEDQAFLRMLMMLWR